MIKLLKLIKENTYMFSIEQYTKVCTQLSLVASFGEPQKFHKAESQSRNHVECLYSEAKIKKKKKG